MSLTTFEVAFMTAVIKGEMKVITFLLPQINLNVQDELGNTFLHQAIKNKREDVIDFLLEQGIMVNVKNNQGQTPIYIAVQYHQNELAKRLLALGADLHVSDNEGQNLLHIASLYANEDFAEYALLEGLDPEAYNKEGKIPLDLAIAKENIKIIELLSLFGSLCGKILSPKLIQLNLKLDNHIVVASFFEELFVASLIEDDEDLKLSDLKNFGMTINTPDQILSRKEQLKKIENQSFTNENEKYSIYQFLLSCLTFNWKYWLSFFNDDKSVLKNIYFNLEYFDNKKKSSPYVGVDQNLKIIIERMKLITKDKLFNARSLFPFSKIEKKISIGLNICYSPELENLLRVLQFEHIKLSDIILNCIKFDRRFQSVRDNWNITKNQLPNDIIIKYENFKKLNFRFSRLRDGATNLTLHLMETYKTELDHFIDHIQQTVFPKDKTLNIPIAIIAASLLLLSVVVFILGITIKLPGYYVIPFVISIPLFVFCAVAIPNLVRFKLNPFKITFIENIHAWVGRDCAAKIHNFRLNNYQSKRIQFMFQEQKANFNALKELLMNILTYMDPEDEHSKNLYDILEQLNRPNFRISELLNLLRDLSKEMEDVIELLENFSINESSNKQPKSFIQLEEYHKKISFFPTPKLNELMDKKEECTIFVKENYMEKKIVVMEIEPEVDQEDQHDEEQPLMVRQFG